MQLRGPAENDILGASQYETVAVLIILLTYLRTSLICVLASHLCEGTGRD